MRFFDYADYEPKTVADRSKYHRDYYLRHRRSIRKKPVMTERERKDAHNAAQRRYQLKKKLQDQ